jgi:hypothetical protein
MPVHDWTRVEAGIFHAFHVTWVPEIQKALNSGVLPSGYYALAEQHAGLGIADVLTLHSSPNTGQLPYSAPTGGVALADAPPRVRWRQTVEGSLLARRRTLAIRHVSGHRLVAILEMVSPANKDRPEHVEDFAAKVVAALDAGVNVVVIDLFPPGRHDPAGMHGAIHHKLEGPDETIESPVDEPLSLIAYATGPKVEIFLERVRVGAALPDMPLFIRPDRYVNVPLESTYQMAYSGFPSFWRNVLEGRPPE